MKFLPGFQIKKHLKKALSWFCSIFLLYIFFLPGLGPVQGTPTPSPPPPTITPTPPAAAPTATPTPGGGIKQGSGTLAAGWYEDPVTTEVGRNSERARQLLFWVVTHPPVYSAPVLARLWNFSRNIVYGFVILVVIAFGVGLIVSKRQGRLGPIFSGVSPPFFGVNIPSIFFKLIAILLYITFSYVLVLGLVQIGETLMQFFIKVLGGADLFNIFFAAQNEEANYSFIGYRYWDPNQRNLDMINTSHFLIRLTSLTYNVMSAILILRAIILWFFIVVAPFLAILMPFIFIRNTGWIWIGTFFQWLFYGPLFALFLGALVWIWKAGIPYSFEFASRVNCSGTSTPRNECRITGQVYPTAINILYGGPAQTLSQTNSANYVDTYAEYVIALIMLWALMLLPWLLLRIFRDYCCEIMASAQATLQSLFDRIRQYPLPPPPPPAGPTTTAGMAVELPFRQKVEEKVYEERRTTIETIRDISKVNTSEIVKAMDLSVSSLADVSRMEMNQMRRSDVKQKLDNIAAPERVSSATERERYASLRSELQQRALKGDRQASTLLAATQKSRESLAAQVALMGTSRAAVAAPGRKEGVFAPSIPTAIPSIGFAPQRPIQEVAKQVGVAEGKVKEVLTAIPTAGMPTDQKAISQVAQKTGVSSAQVQKILASAQARVTPAVAPTVTLEDYEEVKKMWLKHYRSAPIPISETIKSRKQWTVEEEKKLTNIINLLGSADPKLKQKGLTELAEILPFMLLGGFSDQETLTYLKAKLEAAKQVLSETEIEEKAKAEVKKEIEEEELVEVPVKKSEEKAKEASREEKLELPKDDKKITD